VTSGRIILRHVAEFQCEVASTWHQAEGCILQGKGNKVNKELDKVKMRHIGLGGTSKEMIN
jgi:hypothetical protein